MSTILRPYQAQGLEDIRSAMGRGAKSIVYCLPTGGGKTVIFTSIAQGAERKGKRILILVHRGELLRQCREKLTELGVRSGVIKSGAELAYMWPVQVGSVQTIARRLDQIPEPDLIICDEGHHATSPMFQRIFKKWPRARRLLVTATPARLDGKGLGIVADSMILGPDMKTLIAQGFLVPSRVYAPPSALKRDELHTVAGDFNRYEVAAAMDRPVITGSAVEHYRKLCDWKPALAFCTSVEHSTHVAETFTAAGYKAAMIEGKHSDFERHRMITDLARGELHVLASAELIGEGVDIPVVSASIMLRPTKSVTVYLQQAGRAMRIAEGKTHAFIIDHVGNCKEHGLPDELREWTLEGRPKRDKLLGLRTCKQCFCTHVPAPKCPQCGYVYFGDGGGRGAPDVVDGELVEISEEDRVLNAADRHRAEMRDRRREEGMAKSLDELKAIGRKRGYKDSWAHIKWKIRTDGKQTDQALKLLRDAPATTKELSDKLG